VSVLERREHLRAHLHCLGRLEGAVPKKQRSDIRTADELHHHEVGVAGLAPVVDGDDVGVPEHARGAGLAAEPIDEGGIVGQIGMEDLERHIAVEDRVVGSVDLAHAAGSDAGYDLVPAVYGCLDHGSALGGPTSSPF
jgi:hypothetical protein